MPTCRFCKSWEDEDDMVKYEVRHYAHFDCYLDAGKKLSDLWAWQINLFPHRVLKKHGLLDEAAKLIAVETGA
jgi:hypothetical protein